MSDAESALALRAFLTAYFPVPSPYERAARAAKAARAAAG
ncbi:hypothetical protein RB200_38035 [Streptomyces sp. PmtG]